MYTTSDFKKGLRLLIDGVPYTITDFQHVKPGKGNQFTRTKLKSLLDGTNLDRTIKSGEKFEIPNVEYKDMNFLYADEGGFHLMDPITFDQVSLEKDLIGSNANYLIENLDVKVCFFNERIVGIELPKSVQLTVSQTDPGHKGNTVSNTTKPATLQTGLVTQVPLHINKGDTLKINTEDGTYIERVNIKNLGKSYD